jgi:hypothetical protein
MGDTYTNAAFTGVDGAAVGLAQTDREKQAATTVAARFLYMVFLYMAPKIKNKIPPEPRD